MTDPIRTSFPIVCEVLARTGLDNDIDSAIAFALEGEDCLRDALESNVFQHGELMWLLAAALTKNFSGAAGQELERNLAVVTTHLGFDVAHRTYRNKLLVNDKNALEDTQYELAVTAKVCPVLDSQTIELEKPIPNSRKNSDIFGTFQGVPVRIEVTVLHERLPRAIHCELDELMKAAHVSSGFSLALRHTLSDHGYTERATALLELLHEAHLTSGGKDEVIDNVQFTWRSGAYYCNQESSPFTSVTFYSPDELACAADLREIIHPCFERRVTPKHILEDNPNPPWVVTRADLPDAPTDVPVSTKVRQMLQGKLQQCEEGVINIVAFGSPLPMHDREIVSAVRGAEVVTVNAGRAGLSRDWKAPFVPEHLLPDEQRNEFVEPFRKMSAVWHIRLGGYSLSQLIENPNASNPTPSGLVLAISDPSQQRQPLVAIDVPRVRGNVPSSNAQQDDEIVWPEIARDFIAACGSAAEAQRIVAELERMGLSLEELRARADHFWSAPADENASPHFISLSNEQLGMQFIIDCGGHEQAKVCLDEVE
jgi:hypothetical protein